jgi:2-oxo-4-hydroxy-4-carboxy-5-ureidoimidazoline decarboxylase
VVSLSTTGSPLAAFDALSEREAEFELMSVCAAPVWAAEVASGRPYASLEELLARADEVLAGLAESQVDAALAGHPRIGERAAQLSSRREQSQVATAGAEVLDALVEGNREYEERFGHVYLVRADGRSAEELLAVLRDRLRNDPLTERRVLRGELAKINRLRLSRLFPGG